MELDISWRFDEMREGEVELRTRFLRIHEGCVSAARRWCPAKTLGCAWS